MEGYCIWFAEKAMNRLLDTGFLSEDIRKMLSGETTVTIMQATVRVHWEVTEAPVASFADIDQQRETLNEEGEQLEIGENMFTISATTKIWAENNGDSEIPLILVANPVVDDQTLAVAFMMVGLQMDDSYSELDRAILKGACKDLLASVNKALGFDGQTIPKVFSLEFLRNFGIPQPSERGFVRKFGAIGVWESDGYKDFDTGIPTMNQDFGLAVTEGWCKEAISCELRKETSGGWGHFFSIDVGIGTVKGSVTFEVNGKIWCDAVGINNISIRIDPDIRIHLSTNFLVSDPQYAVYIVPSPLHTMPMLEVKDGRLVGEITAFDKFDISVECIEKCTLSWMIVDQVRKHAEEEMKHLKESMGIPIDVPIPDATITMGSTALHAKLTEFENYATGYMRNWYAQLDVSLDE